MTKARAVLSEEQYPCLAEGQALARACPGVWHGYMRRRSMLNEEEEERVITRSDDEERSIAKTLAGQGRHGPVRKCQQSN